MIRSKVMTTWSFNKIDQRFSYNGYQIKGDLKKNLMKKKSSFNLLPFGSYEFLNSSSKEGEN
jgi:hypothetical protein